MIHNYVQIVKYIILYKKGKYFKIFKKRNNSNQTQIKNKNNLKILSKHFFSFNKKNNSIFKMYLFPQQSLRKSLNNIFIISFSSSNIKLPY